MHKSTFFTGQPILSQLIKSLPKNKIHRITREFDSDRYCKKFDTWSHLISMIYSCYQNCTSLREIATGMRACEGRLLSLGLTHFPCRSTISDANQRRSSLIFENIFYSVYEELSRFLPDSRIKKDLFRKVFIIDSTTITLFQEILKAAGRPPGEGRKKGGLKVHMMVNAQQDVPCLVRITSAATNDTKFLKQVHLPAGSYAVFDKGYNSFYQYNRLANQGVSWITRQRRNYVVIARENFEISEKDARSGVLKDQRIIMGYIGKKDRVKCRRVTYFDKVNNRVFEFITNNTRIAASTVAAIYKQRWQIELLFKRLKQNMPLQYFLGNNENAIRIQIWCTLIADLLLKVATCGIKRKWAFSNLSSMIRLHLMSYTSLKSFLNSPEKAVIRTPIIDPRYQMNLFSSA